MKVLQVHEYYQQPGGEDQVVAAERSLLTGKGHEVRQFLVHNDRVAEFSAVELATATIWSRESYRAIRSELRELRADVMHVHNTLPLLSPAVYYAAAAESVPVVQTLHNYRLVCPAGTLFRDGSTCEDCVGKAVTWPSVLHACYRNSRTANLAITSMLAFHKLKGTWSERVNEYVALTDFARDVYIRGGLPAEKISVKPNFVDLEAAPRRSTGPSTNRFALFVGRLAPEKGLNTLLDAWRELGAGLPLKVVGDGPLAAEVKRASQHGAAVEWLGRRPSEEVLDLMREAYLLVFPSTWYEGFPVTLAEAFACGLPVLASDLGSMRSVVEDGLTGRRFPAGNATALAETVRWAVANPGRVEEMGLAARREYEQKYSPETNYRQLQEIYRRAIERARAAADR